MVLGLLGGKTGSQQGAVDTREAFNVWDIVNSKYVVVERMQLWVRLAHDKDLKLVMQSLINTLNENIVILEKQMQRFAINGPDQNRSASNIPSNTQVIIDEFIALDVLVYLQGHVENLLRYLRTSFTNDSLRDVLYKMAVKTINDTDMLMKYLKVKGWIGTPPLYRDLPKAIQEKVSTAEVSNLWDHLTYRYDNIYTTTVIKNLAYDGDFKLTLDSGLRILKRQVDTLEREIEYFGIPMPKKPPKVIVAHNTEVFDDDHLYRTLLIGFQGAAIFHAQSFKQCTFNDRIRGIFRQLLFEEMDIIDKFIKFGKLKGWLNSVPMFSP